MLNCQSVSLCIKLKYTVSYLAYYQCSGKRERSIRTLNYARLEFFPRVIGVMTIVSLPFLRSRRLSVGSVVYVCVCVCVDRLGRYKASG